MIETGVRDFLNAQPSVNGIAKSQSPNGTKTLGVFCVHPTAGFNPPYVTITTTDNDPMNSLDQPTGGLETTEFEISCYSHDYGEVLKLRNAVRDALKDYRGEAGPDDTIKAVWFNGARPEDEPEGQGGDMRLYTEVLSFTIQHQPTRAS